MTVNEVMQELEALGSAQTKKTLMNHGAKEPFFGVKVSDLKTILKKNKKNHSLALELYNTGNSDAMYLAGLMVDPKKMDKSLLQTWADKAYWYMLSEYTVAWVAAESSFGLELALEWIEAKEENIACSGWATLSNIAGYLPDEQIDKDLYSKLLDRVCTEISSERNRVRYTMNGFIIAVGAYIPSLKDKALSSAEKIGKVNVSMGGTSCKVPDASEYIIKVLERNPTSKKKKDLRC